MHTNLLMENCTATPVAARRTRRILQHLNPGLPPSIRTIAACTSDCESYFEIIPSSASGSDLSDGAYEKKDEETCKIENRKVKIEGRKHVLLVVGAGDATGGAVAKRFAKEGYVACLVRRNASKLDALAQEILHEGGEAHAFGVDARKEGLISFTHPLRMTARRVVALVEQIEKDIGEIRVLVFNIGANVNFSILQTTSRVYQKVWEMACFAGFLAGREVAKQMVTRDCGTIIFTGATASMRGGSGYAAFSGAKFGLRALAQSMARELGPRGIHVAHVIVDAAIDTQWTRGRVENPTLLIERQGMISPQDIGETYWQIHQQPKTAWSHEMDLRPWIENW